VAYFVGHHEDRSFTLDELLEHSPGGAHYIIFVLSASRAT